MARKTRILTSSSKPRRVSIAVLLFVVLASQHSSAFQSKNVENFLLHAVKINDDITLTGKLDDPKWTVASRAEIPYEIIPGENIPASQRTTAMVLYNSEYVYFGFRCLDNRPEEIRAHISDRDRIFDDDFVIVFLDTYGDNQRSYNFFVNPYGIQADILRNGSNEDDSFDTVWKSAAAINDSGWTAELAIPFKSIRFPSKSEQEWVVLLGRNYPRSSAVIFSWTPYDRNNPCLICQGGTLKGIHDIQAITSFEVLPYVAALQTSGLKDPEDPLSEYARGKVQGRAGFGFRYAPSPDLGIDAVVNPDFSQVESDAQQISVNSTFALFYPEKRPFFLIGTDLFQNMTNTFYSRTINNPIAAAKVVGKLGGLSYGYLAASDRETPFIIPGEEDSEFQSTLIESFSNIARLRYDLGSESFIGGMVTTRNTSSAHNYVGGIDWNYLFWGNYYVRGELFYSDTKEINDKSIFDGGWMFGNSGRTASFDGEQYGGTAYRIDLRRDARDYSFNISYRDMSPTFQAQNGFVASNNFRTITAGQRYTFYSTESFMDLGTLLMEAGLHYNYSGERKERWFVPGAFAQLKGQTNVFVGYLLVNDEQFRGVLFEGLHRLVANANSRPLSSLSLSLNAEVGRFIRREDDPSLGTGHNLRVAVTVKPTSQLQIEVSYARSRLSSISTDELFFDGYIGRTVAIYQFTPELFLRTIAQYNSFDESLSLYPLLSYKLNPFTIFYAGFTDDSINFHDSNNDGFTTTARQFFVKFQYLLRN